MKKLQILFFLITIQLIDFDALGQSSFDALLSRDLECVRELYRSSLTFSVISTSNQGNKIDPLSFQIISDSVLTTSFSQKLNSKFEIIRYEVVFDNSFIKSVQDKDRVFSFYVVRKEDSLYKLFGFFTCDIGVEGIELVEEVQAKLVNLDVLSKRESRKWARAIYTRKVLPLKEGLNCNFLELIFGKNSSQSRSIICSLQEPFHMN